MSQICPVCKEGCHNLNGPCPDCNQEMCGTCWHAHDNESVCNVATETLRARIAELEAVLEQYAEKNNWDAITEHETEECWIGWNHENLDNGYPIARRVLGLEE